MSPLTISVIVFLCTIVAFFSGKVALGLIGIGASVVLQLTGVMDSATIWGNFVNSSVVMFAALFVLSAGLMKTSLINNIVEKLSAVQGNQRKVLWVCLTISIVMSIFMNSTAAIAAMLPVILTVCERSKVNARKIIKPCTDMANMWTGSLPVGMGASGYLTTNMLIQKLGGTQEMGIMDNAIMKVPPLLVAAFVYYFFSEKFTPNEPLKPVEGTSPSQAVAKTAQLSPVKEKLCYIIFVMTVGLMLTSGILRWSNPPTFMFPVCGAILMVASGVLSAPEAAKKIPIDSVLLVGGMLNVAGALGSTGGATIIGDTIAKILGGSTNTYFVLIVLYMVPFICTQFMNNIAVANAFNTLGIATCLSIGIDPRLGALATGLAATSSLLTPMASAPQAMIMGPGQYKFTDYIKSSIIPAVIFIAAFMIYCPLMAKLIWKI